MPFPRWFWPAFAFAVVPARASAFTIETPFSEGCHERITSQALRAVRAENHAGGPIAASRDEQALIDDLQFTPEDDMNDLGGATLLAAVRDNDLKGRGAADLSQLAEVHGDPANQKEHCLRSSDDVEPNGTGKAIAACRGFIHDRVAEALDGLGADGAVDPSKRTALTIHLALRGKIDAPLPTFYVRIGQAIHAVQDSFAHAFRTEDGRSITTDLDWVREVNGDRVESRDGPAHLSELDRCDDPDDRRKIRHQLAIDASTAILRTALDASQTRDEKVAAVDAILDVYLGVKPGCTSDNGWCDAPERAYPKPSACGCSVPGSGDGGTLAIGAAGLIALAACARGARRRSHARSAAGRAGRPESVKRVIAGIIGLACIGGATTARAQGAPEPAPTTTPNSTTSTAPSSANVTTGTSTTSTTSTASDGAAKPAVDTAGKALSEEERNALPPPPKAPVAEPGKHDAATTFGAYAGVAGSIDKTALAGAVGARLRVSRHWAFGLDAEWNPWIAVTGSTLRAGTFNAYGSAILRFPLAYEAFNLRTSVAAGTSYLLFDLYGAPKGSLGIYFGVTPLAVEWKAASTFYVIVAPLSIDVPVPQLKGVPLLFPQYRLTIGIEFYTG